MKSDDSQVGLLTSVLTHAMASLEGIIPNNTEIILHNLMEPERSVMKIINGHVSGRSPGDGLLSGPNKDTGFAALLIKKNTDVKPVVIKDYSTTTQSGKVLSSASTIYYGSDGEPLIAFCINIDNAALDYIRKGMELLAPSKTLPDNSVSLDVGNILQEAIDEVIVKHAHGNGKIKKELRHKIVSEMNERGIFKMKGGMQLAASALGVTRYTIYSDVEVVNERKK